MKRASWFWVFAVWLLVPRGQLGAQERVTFREHSDAALSAFVRVGSTAVPEVTALHERSLVTPVGFDDLFAAPMTPRGLAGVAMLDYDGDGDLDLYVTNGAGAPNALYANRLVESGALGFEDVAASAGVRASDHDSFGTCFGDTDNDGDDDLLVLGRDVPNRFFINRGDGTFGESDALGGGARSSTVCAMADFDGDGLLDVVVGNSFDMDDSFAIFVEPYALNQHNQLFRNDGDNRFSDISGISGITNNGSFYEGRAGITWAVAAVDVDVDGDVDVVFADDQGAILPEHSGCAALPPGPIPCEDRALIHVFLNDGTGNFVDRPVVDSPYASTEWMGLAFGDLDCSGTLDMFASSFGDYGNFVLAPVYTPESSNSRWLLGDGSGGFEDVGVGALTSTPFGWGAAIFDYDNDGDPDILFHGGLDAANMVNIMDNPGALLENQGCRASFRFDTDAITVDHTTRNVRGVAVGDLDRNGFADVATAANWRNPPETPLQPMPVLRGSPFDETAFFGPVLVPVNGPLEPPAFQWTGATNLDGDFKVELNDGANENGSVTVDLVGSVDLVPGAIVNRSGIGAVLSFTPDGGVTQTLPMSGGSSHASQSALERIFGLGDATRGNLDIHWPGGARNRLYGVRTGERLTVPELPCSYEDENFGRYVSCVVRSVVRLRRAGVVGRRTQIRLLASAVLAHLER